MFGFLKFLLLCALAVAAGVAAVSVPVAGKTVAAHVESWLGEPDAEAPARRAPARKPVPAPVRPSIRAAARPAAAPGPAAAPLPAATPKPRAAESDPTPAERSALENLIGAKTAGPPGQGR
jgi:hypothetical protein